jgi:hypothetical protein
MLNIYILTLHLLTFQSQQDLSCWSGQTSTICTHGSESTCSCGAPVLRYYYLQNLEVDLADAVAEADDAQEDVDQDRPSAAKFDLLVETGSCELGLRYPNL